MRGSINYKGFEINYEFVNWFDTTFYLIIKEGFNRPAVTYHFGEPESKDDAYDFIAKYIDKNLLMVNRRRETSLIAYLPIKWDGTLESVKPIVNKIQSFNLNQSITFRPMADNQGNFFIKPGDWIITLNGVIEDVEVEDEEFERRYKMNTSYSDTLAPSILQVLQ